MNTKYKFIIATVLVIFSIVLTGTLVYGSPFNQHVGDFGYEDILNFSEFDFVIHHLLITHDLEVGGTAGYNLTSQMELVDTAFASKKYVDDTVAGGGGGNGTSIFGSEFERFESLGQTNTASSLVNKLSITTASKPAGLYRIGFTVDVTNSDGTDIWKVQFLVNGTAIHQHVNGADEYENKPNGNNDWEVYSTFSYLNLTNTSTVDIAIKFGTNDNTARASNAIIEIWRVS